MLNTRKRETTLTISGFNPPKPITSFPYTMGPLTQITPFSYRDGLTYARMVEDLRTYLNQFVIPALNSQLEEIFADFITGIENAENTIIAEREEWQRLFDAFMGDLTGRLEALNDVAMSNLIKAPSSQTSIALADIYATKTAVAASIELVNGRMDAFDALVTTGRLSAVEMGKLATNVALGGTNQNVANNAAAITQVRNDLNALGLDYEAHVVDLMAPFKAAVKAQSTKAFTFVNLGSSTAAGGVPTLGNKGYINRLAALFGDREVLRFDETVFVDPPSTGNQFYSGAKGGTTSSNYLDETQIGRIQRIKPAVVTHMVGVNDANGGMTPAAFEANLRMWLGKIKFASPDTQNIYIMQKSPGVTTYKWELYLNVARTLAAECKTPFINMNDVFSVLGDEGNDRYGVMADSLHFGDLGNRFMTEYIGAYLGAPSMRLFPREMQRATTFAGGAKTEGSNVICTIRVKRKPYMRDGVASFVAYVSAVGGQNDMTISVNQVGGAGEGRLNQRLTVGATATTVTGDVSLTMFPNVDYDVILAVSCYPGGVATISSSSAFMRFHVDLSPS